MKKKPQRRKRSSPIKHIAKAMDILFKKGYRWFYCHKRMAWYAKTKKGKILGYFHHEHEMIQSGFEHLKEKMK